jgi:hypothetical protein
MMSDDRDNRTWEETHHEEGCDDPVDDNTERNLNPNLSGLKRLVQGLVSHFAQYRVHHDQQSNRLQIESARLRKKCLKEVIHVPMGIETPTKEPFLKSRSVLGTKLPRIIPTAIARKIHTARKRSKMPKFLNTDCGFESCTFEASLLFGSSGTSRDLVAREPGDMNLS